MNRPGSTGGPPRPPSSNLPGAPTSAYRTSSSSTVTANNGYPYNNSNSNNTAMARSTISSAAGYGAAPGLQRQTTGGLQQLPAGTIQQQGQQPGYGNGNGMLAHRSQTFPFQQQPSPNTSHTHRATTPGAVSISSASESLDPMEFPALGSAPTAVNSSVTGVSYASQAGQQLVGGGQQGTIGGARERDFGPDDFPALGGSAQAQAQQQDLHPPGLNGFQQQTMPGVLSLGLGASGNGGATGRSVHPGFQQHAVETDNNKRYAALKTAQQAQAAWNNPSPTQQPGQQVPLSVANGQPQQQGHIGSTANAGTGYNGITDPSHARGGHLHSQQNQSHRQPQQQQQHPQTPAQQVLVSAADRWGLLGLLAMIKNAGKEMDGGLSNGVGTDLGTMGLDVGFSGNLYSTFITPWADSTSARHIVEPEFHLPSCYDVRAPPPGPNKAAAFSDETLFFMFYTSPKDALQEVAAQELWNRNWRYHKSLHLWITKETGTSASQKISNASGEGERGQYTFWDPENWGKERREMEVMYRDLEEKNVPAFMPGMGLVLASTGLPIGSNAGGAGVVGQSQQQQQQQQQQQVMAVGQQRFQAAGMA